MMIAKLRPRCSFPISSRMNGNFCTVEMMIFLPLSMKRRRSPDQWFALPEKTTSDHLATRAGRTARGSHQYVGVDNDSHSRDDSIYDVFHKRTADSSHAGVDLRAPVVAPLSRAVWLREATVR